MKTCNKCQQTKDLAEFSICRRSKDGRQYVCKTCFKQYTTKKPTTVEYERTRLLRRYYNLTPDGYNALLTQQNGVCAICKTAPIEGKYLCVDHCHYR